MRLPILLLGCGFLSSPLLFAEDYQGADVILKHLADAQKEKDWNVRSVNTLGSVLTKFIAFQGECEVMPPEKAAARWLDLVDQYLALPPSRSGLKVWELHALRHFGSDPPFIEALPPTAAWDAIAKSLDERAGRSPKIRNAAFGVLAASMRDDIAARKKALQALHIAFTSSKRPADEGQQFFHTLDDLAESIAKEDGDSEAEVALFEKRLAALEAHQDRNRFTGFITVPDLAILTDRGRAAALIRRAFALGNDLQIFGKKTRKLASELASENIGLLRKPLWNLVEDLGDAPLYEKMEKRFPERNEQDRNDRTPADAVYLASLIASDRQKEAAKFVRNARTEMRGGDLFSGDDMLSSVSPPCEKCADQIGSFFGDDLLERLVENGSGGQMTAFLRESLASDPSLPFWRDYIELAARWDSSDRALAFLREIAARQDLKPDARKLTDEYLARALLAANHVEDGIAVLREMIKAGGFGGDPRAGAARGDVKRDEATAGAVPSSQALGETGDDPRGRVPRQVELCLQLGRIGALTGQADLVNEAITGAMTALAARHGSLAQTASLDGVLRFLLSQGRGAEAEKIVAGEMAAAGYNLNDSRPLCEMLAVIYDRAGRYGDVMRLLDGARQWGWVDVSAFSSDEKFGSPLLFVAARALFKTGKTEQARGALRRTIERFPGYDPAYALLLEMGGADTEPYLDMLAKRDRFEKRPLIWKAKLQLDAGRIEEAEKTVRTAIAIDPSDGEQGKGDRMRAYAVLGDTLDKKGVPEQAKVVRGAVQAIRLSEDADDWWKAGLLTRAVKMYEQALDHFADAYCIQSRLALRYFELGDFQNAGRHYERAFELMSESFGRIESHCFGCEGVFRGVQAQGIADRVFSRLVKQMPDKPQAHYFLGRLRQQQGRAAEAAVQFKMAVKLDPDYLSAWSSLIAVSYYASLSPEEIEAADLALLRLDPGMRHHSGAFTRMRDMRPAWDAVLAAEKTRPPISNEPIYPLTVSKIEIEDRAKSFRAAGDLFSAEKAIEMGTRSDTIDAASLRSEFAKQRILTYLMTFFFVVESR